MEPKTPRRTCKGGKQPAAVPGEERAKPGTKHPSQAPHQRPLPAPAEKAGGTGDYVIGRRKLNERLLNCGNKDKSGDNIEEKEKRKEIKEEKIKKLKKKR